MRTRADRTRTWPPLTAIVLVALLMAASLLMRSTGYVSAADEIGGPLPDLSPDELARFQAGAALFSKVHGPQDGLGPTFNGRACADCHSLPAPGGADKTRSHRITRIGRDAGGSHDDLIDVGGPVLSQQSVAGLLPGCGLDSEKKPKSATAVSERQPPSLYGLGLVAAIPDETLEALAATQQANGEVAGRVNRSAGATGDGVGRFGAKAQFATLDAFIADALRNELGITNPRLPDEKPTSRLAGPTCDLVPDPEDDGTELTALVDFVSMLAPPPRGPIGAAERRGEAIFSEVGCASCHVPSLRTGPSPIAALADQDVPLYSDLLLHDLGDELADGIRQGDAGGSEWRTAPLWGIGRRLWFLHDGRATDLRTAVELHNGDAKDARDRLFKRRRDDLQDVLTFLRSL